MVKRYQDEIRTKHFYEDEYEVYGVYENEHGDYVTFSDYQLIQKRLAEVERERDEYKALIAKARVMFLELDELEQCSEEFLFLLSDIFSLFCGGIDLSEILNKRDIEQQIKGVEDFIYPYKNGVTYEYVEGGYGLAVLHAAEPHIEQLRQQLNRGE